MEHEPIIPEPFKDMTPLMRQYHEIKQSYPHELLFFQVGDFYELFFDDAQKAAMFLGIALTARGTYQGKPIPLCGVPMHTRDHYLQKLVKGGFHVAICDQLELPRPGTVVKRGVTQVLTPGTLTDLRLLDAKTASYLMTCVPSDAGWALLFGELLTAQLMVTIIKPHDPRVFEAELVKFFPDEIIVPRYSESRSVQQLLKQLGYESTLVPALSGAIGDHDPFQQWVAMHCSQQTRAIIAEHDQIAAALYYFYAYIERNQVSALEQMHTVTYYHAEDFLTLDGATQLNLELVKNREGTTKNTLFSVIDRAMTPMGSRLIKKWLLRPLKDIVAIRQRQDLVTSFKNDIALMQYIGDLLIAVGDIERVVGRIALQKGVLADLLQVLSVAKTVPLIRERMVDVVSGNNPLASLIIAHLGSFDELIVLLEQSLTADLGSSCRIKKGYDQELDRLRDHAEHGHEQLLQLEEQEQRRTGIGSLKIRYNSVHGYYIEVTKANMHLVPTDYIRQQTLAGRERFITPELQRMAYAITTARSCMEQREQELFDSIQKQVRIMVGPLRKCAYALAHIDAFLGLARAAYEYRYVSPIIAEHGSLMIMQGRHPVVERRTDVPFIPNDLVMTDASRVWIITGPNMGGKSTFLRQVALVVILTHIGSYVPAQEAHVSLVDRVFTRIGAGDDVARGKSTFLVEMEETAAICMQATSSSLIILDEVGRGTSTFDGMVIAQAVVEYLYTQVKAKTLFATHYQELTHLHEQHSGIVNYYAKSLRTPTGILFLYQMVPGFGDGSFGIEVAHMAQVPMPIIERARTLLQEIKTGTGLVVVSDAGQPVQSLASVAPDHRSASAVVAERMKGLLTNLDMEQLTPKKAFDLVWQLHELVTDHKK